MGRTSTRACFIRLADNPSGRVQAAGEPDKLAIKAADAIDWSASCLVCIAADFTGYDITRQQINRNIELIRHRHWRRVVAVELANATSGGNVVRPIPWQGATQSRPPVTSRRPVIVPFAEWLPLLPGTFAELLSLGGLCGCPRACARKELRLYLAFKRSKLRHGGGAKRNRLLLYLYLNLTTWGHCSPWAAMSDSRALGYWGRGIVSHQPGRPGHGKAVDPHVPFRAQHDGPAGRMPGRCGDRPLGPRGSAAFADAIGGRHVGRR